MTGRQIPPSFPSSLQDALTRYEGSQVRWLTAGWLTRAGAALLLPFLAGILIDWSFDLSPSVRAVPLALSLALPLWATAWLLMAPLWRGDRETLAGEIDQAHGKARDALRSSLNLLARDAQQPGCVNPFMLDQTVRTAEAAFSGVDASRYVSLGRTPRWLGLFLALVASVVVLSFLPEMQMGLLAKRFFNPWGNYPRPSRTRIHVLLPPGQTLTQGDDCDLHVRLSGHVYEGIGSFLHLIDEQGNESRLPMSPRPDQHFLTRLKNLSKPIQFFITAGDGRTQRLEIDVVSRPRITAMTVRYKFPSYTGLEPVEEPVKFREVKAVEGTRILISFDTDQPIDDSWADVSGKKQKIRWDRSARKGNFSFILDRAGALKIHLATRDGRANKYDSPYTLKVIPDNPPVVSFVQVPESLTLYRDDLLRFSYKGMDDFGIAEVFVRFKHPNMRDSSALSLEFTQAGVKEFTGEAVLEVRDLIDRGQYSEEAQGFELSVVMLDSKDQEGSTQKIQIQVISETPDRQLQELNDLLIRYSGALSDAAGLARSQAGQVKILVDGMNDDTEFSAKHAELLGGVRAALGRIGFPDPLNLYDRTWKVYRYGQYPYAAGNAAEELMTLPFSFYQGSAYTRKINASDSEPRRRAALAQLHALLEQQSARLDPWASAFRDCIKENHLQVLSYTIDYYLLEARKFSGNTGSSSAGGGDREVLAVHREKQAKRLAFIAEAVHPMGILELTSPAARAAAEKIIDIRKDENATEEQARPWLEELQTCLLAGPFLDGRLRKALHDWLRATPLPDRIRTAEKEDSLPALAHSLLVKIILRADNPSLNSAELLLDCMALQAIRSRSPARLQAILPLLENSQRWAQISDLFERVRLLRRDLAEFEADRASRRLRPGSADFVQKWFELRENFLALLADNRAGAFSAIDPSMQEQIESLRPFAPLFHRWFWQLAPISFDARAGPLLERLESFASALEPQALSGLPSIEPQLMALLEDLASNARAETAILQHEIQEFEKEIAMSIDTVAQLALLSDAQRKEQLRGDRGRTNPDRIGAAIALVQRLTGYSIAAGKAIDFQEQSWAQKPDMASGLDWLRAGENLSEFLRHLDEQTYDTSVAPHLRAQYTSMVYPGYLKEIVQYYQKTIPALEGLGEEIHLLVQRKPEALLHSPEYSKRMLRIHKNQSYKETVGWIESHAQFFQRLEEAGPDAARLQALLSDLAHHGTRSATYWRRLYLAFREVLGLQFPFSAAAAERAAALESLLRSLERIEFLTQRLEPFPDELKNLREVVEDFGPLSRRLQAAVEKTLEAEESAALSEDFEDWRGKMLAFQESLEVRMAPPAVKFKTRQRYGQGSRFDLDWVLNRILRNEARWLERLVEEEQQMMVHRADAVLGQLRPPEEAARARRRAGWQMAHLLASRRKSQTAQSQQSRGLTWDLEGEAGRQPKMPEHLYQELRRAMKKNYPQYFRDLGLRYLRGLSEDAF